MLTLEQISFQTHPLALSANLLEEIEHLWPHYPMQLAQDGGYCLDPQEMKRLGICDASFGDPVQSTDLEYLLGYLQGLQQLPRDAEYGVPVFLERPEETRRIQQLWTEEF